MPQTAQQRIQKAIVLLRTAEKHIGDISLQDGPEILPEAKATYGKIKSAIDSAKKLKAKYPPPPPATHR